MNCSRCNKKVQDDNFFSFAKTHGKLFLVQGTMKGSYTNERNIFCDNCAEKIKTNLN
jgi:hypothetical protein